MASQWARSAMVTPLAGQPAELLRLPVGARIDHDVDHRGLAAVVGLLQRGRDLFRPLDVEAGSAESFDDIFAAFLDEWSGENSPVIGFRNDPGSFASDLGLGVPDEIRIMYCDAVSYLPDDILCKVDRASMAVSLETRVPFLDHRVAEVAARIPLSMKIRKGRGKHILRELLYRHAPRNLFERPKAGFAIPVGEWIEGPLRDWAEDLLDPAKMAADGWLDPSIVRNRWNDHLSGRRDSTPAIWAVLMFQAWLQNQRGDQSAAA